MQSQSTRYPGPIIYFLYINIVYVILIIMVRVVHTHKRPPNGHNNKLCLSDTMLAS
jgi:hypothetical protein